MKRWMRLEWNPARTAAAGLIAGITLGLIEVIMLEFIDLVHRPLSDLFVTVLVYGALGFLIGLDMGLLRGASVVADRPGSETHRERWSYLGRHAMRGMGAGLVAGAAVGLVEIAGLMLVDWSWWPLTGLLYAVVAYGILGLGAGLSLGLLGGLWRTWRARDDDPIGRSTWIATLPRSWSLRWARSWWCTIASAVTCWESRHIT